jgi:hypothetical protein
MMGGGIQPPNPILFYFLLYFLIVGRIFESPVTQIIVFGDLCISRDKVSSFSVILWFFKFREFGCFPSAQSDHLAAIMPMTFQFWSYLNELRPLLPVNYRCMNPDGRVV